MPDNTDFWKTSLAAALDNTLRSSTAQVAHLNDELKQRYLQTFNDWTISVLAGRIDNMQPPQPPPAWKLSAPNADGFVFYEPGKDGDPVVTPLPPIPEDHSKPQSRTQPEPTTVMNVPQGDTMPVGFIAVAPDGTKWQKQASPTPFGVAYFYAKIA